MAKFDSMAPSYKNFNALKWSTLKSNNIESIYDYLEDCVSEMSLPDTTKEFLEKVQKRLENEQKIVDRDIRDRWQKEQKSLIRRNRKIEREKLKQKQV